MASSKPCTGSGSGRYKKVPNSVVKEIVRKENNRHKKSTKTRKNKK